MIFFFFASITQLHSGQLPSKRGSRRLLQNMEPALWACPRCAAAETCWDVANTQHRAPRCVCMARNSVWAHALGKLLLMLGCSSSEAEMDPSHEKISVAAKHYHQARTGPLEIIWVFSVSSETRCEQGLLLRGTAWETEKIGIFVL